MTLTDSQLEKLRANRRDTVPNYYDYQDNSTYPIPQDTEDALILLKAETKREAISYINAYVNSSPSAFTQDYNDLLEEFVEQQQANSNATTQELEQVTGKFNAFRTKLRGDMSEASLIIEDGMQPVLEVMTATLGRLSEIDKSEYFHNTFDSAMTAQFTQEVTNDLKKALRSWQRVIASYP